jgi:hypothetical protein
VHPEHVPLVQTGEAFEQSVPVAHCVHAPLAAQIGVVPEHWELAVQGWHAPVVSLQTGLVPLQSALVRQATHVDVVVLHFGVGAAQSAFVAHPPWGPIFGFVSSHVSFSFDHSFCIV